MGLRARGVLLKLLALFEFIQVKALLQVFASPGDHRLVLLELGQLLFIQLEIDERSNETRQKHQQSGAIGTEANPKHETINRTEEVVENGIAEEVANQQESQPSEDEEVCLFHYK